jgi:hypothetical protein
MYANISGISNVISYQRKFAKSEQISTCGYFNQVRLDKNQRICHFCRVKCAQSCPNYGICLRINITLTNACYYETPSPLPYQVRHAHAHMRQWLSPDHSQRRTHTHAYAHASGVPQHTISTQHSTAPHSTPSGATEAHTHAHRHTHTRIRCTG